MTPSPIRKSQLSNATTATLIEQYDLTQANYGKRDNATGPTRLQLRINLIVDLISDRANTGDQVALSWFERN